MGDEHLVLVASEFPEPIDILPHLWQRGMKNMRTITVALNARFLIQ